MACDSPFWVLPKGKFEKVPVPCGRCPPCKKRRVDSWVFRLVYEKRLHDNCHFITLTYDTNHVPISKNKFMTLNPKDLQNFWKRLRKNTNAEIKYYACGEYGSRNKRPHYHAIVFGIDDPNEYVKAWTLDGIQIGYVHVGEVTNDSIAYCMKYIDKFTSKKMHLRDDRVSEFARMSKGLGLNYLSEQVKQFHKADIKRMYCVVPGGYKIALPRYFRERLYDENERKLQTIYVDNAIKEKEQFTKTHYRGILSYDEYKERSKIARFKNFYNNQKVRD